MKVFYCLITNLLLCIFYDIGIEILEKYMPISKCDVGIGIMFRYGIILLSLTMLLQMIIKLYVKKRTYITLLPILIPMLYWLSYYDIFPYRSFFILVVNWVVCMIYYLSLIHISSQGIINEILSFYYNDKPIHVTKCEYHR